MFWEPYITNISWWILKCHLSLHPGVNHCHGRIPSTDLASWQAEAYHHHRSVPSGCVRPHLGQRCGEKTDAGNSLCFTFCSIVLGVEFVPTAFPSLLFWSSKSLSVPNYTWPWTHSQFKGCFCLLLGSVADNLFGADVIGFVKNNWSE